MARQAGWSGVLTMAGVGRLGLTNLAVNPTRETPDATGMDSGGYGQSVDGIRRLTFTASYHADSAGPGGIPLSVQLAGTRAFILDTDAGGVVDGTLEAVAEGAWVEA